VYAPRIVTVQVKPDKVRDIIGPGGKTIRAIQEQTGAQIDINDNGTVSIASSEAKAIEQAQALIAGLTMEPEVGLFYNGIVKKIVEIGAFVGSCPAPTASCTSAKSRRSASAPSRTCCPRAMKSSSSASRSTATARSVCRAAKALDANGPRRSSQLRDLTEPVRRSERQSQ
jgi:polyribonucleotide nucleotidyltransferase